MDFLSRKMNNAWMTTRKIFIPLLQVQPCTSQKPILQIRKAKSIDSDLTENSQSIILVFHLLLFSD